MNNNAKAIIAAAVVLVGGLTCLWGPLQRASTASQFPEKVLYEMEGVPEEVARQALRLAAHKLPLATRFTAREHHS